MTARRVLVIGGSGAFGSRLVERLLATTISWWSSPAATKRAPRRAAAGLSGLHPGFAVEPVVLDTATDRRRPEGPRLWAVVDAAGPWQGPRRGLRKPRSMPAATMSISPTRDFVRTIPPLDARARRAGVVVLTGASSDAGPVQRRARPDDAQLGQGRDGLRRHRVEAIARRAARP
jgi:hypothetical protein